MRVCVLGSGSKGNSTLVCSASTAILIDAGLSARELDRRLAECGAGSSRISGVCVSHEHTDHVSGLPVFHRKHRPALFANAGTREALVAETELAALPWQVFETGQAFTIGDLTVEPFSVSHDAYDPVGFVVGDGATRVGIATDIGIATEMVRQRLRACQVVVLEANHDEYLLRNSKRPPPLIQRILGRQGHLSNDGAARLLADIASPELSRIYLAHLSADCNRPDLALKAVQTALTRKGLGGIPIHLTYADRISDPWEAGGRSSAVAAASAAGQ
jgi:phosphoribosyl 1,2-cyclic phosphodiesterase